MTETRTPGVRSGARVLDAGTAELDVAADIVAGLESDAVTAAVCALLPLPVVSARAETDASAVACEAGAAVAPLGVGATIPGVATDSGLEITSGVLAIAVRDGAVVLVEAGGVGAVSAGAAVVAAGAAVVAVGSAGVEDAGSERGDAPMTGFAGTSTIKVDSDLILTEF